MPRSTFRLATSTGLQVLLLGHAPVATGLLGELKARHFDATPADVLTSQSSGRLRDLPRVRTRGVSARFGGVG